MVICKCGFLCNFIFGTCTPFDVKFTIILKWLRCYIFAEQRFTRKKIDTRSKLFSLNLVQDSPSLCYLVPLWIANILFMYYLRPVYQYYIFTLILSGTIKRFSIKHLGSYISLWVCTSVYLKTTIVITMLAKNRIRRIKSVDSYFLSSHIRRQHTNSYSYMVT